MPGMEDPTPGFDDPLGVLRACHRRIAERLDLLERLPEYLETHGPDTAAQSAAQRVLNYFERAAGHHHADEEEDLFPILREARGRPGWDDRLMAVLEELEVEHQRLAWRWARVQPSLVAIARGKRGPALRPEALIQAYHAHMKVEDEVILPLADLLLNPPELQRMGAAMQKRRGLSDPGISGDAGE